MSALVKLERSIATSLAGFVRIAWQHVEPFAYVHGRHIEAVCAYLEEVTRGTILRGVINIPPGMGKSLLTGVFWPAWVWGPYGWGAARWFYSSYDQGLVNRDATKLVQLISSDWYTARWGRKIGGGTLGVSDFRTTDGGGRFSTSVGGRGTGRHAHFLIGDDLIKPRDANGTAAVSGKVLDRTWATWDHTYASRAIESATFRRLIIGQRVHEADPSGHALKAGYEGLILPMRLNAAKRDPRDWRTEDLEWLCPARFGQAAADNLDITPEVWATQYQQEPSLPGGSIFADSWIEGAAINYDEIPSDGFRGSSWDLTFKGEETSDYIAGQAWATKRIDGKLHHFWRVSDPVFQRADIVQTLDLMRQREQRWGSSIVMLEDKANGPAAERLLREEIRRIRLMTPSGSKVSRAHACAPAAAKGRVHLVRCAAYEETKRILTRFPHVRRDDPVDALTQWIVNAQKTGASFHASMDLL